MGTSSALYSAASLSQRYTVEPDNGPSEIGTTSLNAKDTCLNPMLIIISVLLLYLSTRDKIIGPIVSVFVGSAVYSNYIELSVLYSEGPLVGDVTPYSAEEEVADPFTVGWPLTPARAKVR